MHPSVWPSFFISFFKSNILKTIWCNFLVPFQKEMEGEKLGTSRKGEAFEFKVASRLGMTGSSPALLLFPAPCSYSSAWLPATPKETQVGFLPLTRPSPGCRKKYERVMCLPLLRLSLSLPAFQIIFKGTSRKCLFYFGWPCFGKVSSTRLCEVCVGLHPPLVRLEKTC